MGGVVGGGGGGGGVIRLSFKVLWGIKIRRSVS